MILQCPNCNARFLVPDAAIGTDGRTVRCGRCKHSWTAHVPETAHAATMPPPPMPDFDELMAEASNTSAATSAATSRNLPIVRAPARAPWWLRSVAIASATACTLVSVLTWQPQWLGYPSTIGVQLKDIKYRKTQNKSHQARYIVEGMLVNTNNARVAAPIIRISLLDNDDRRLQFWDFEDKTINIEPGQEIPFTADQLDTRLSKGTQLLVELGNALELAQRNTKPHLPARSAADMENAAPMAKETTPAEATAPEPLKSEAPPAPAAPEPNAPLQPEPAKSE